MPSHPLRRTMERPLSRVHPSSLHTPRPCCSLTHNFKRSASHRGIMQKLCNINPQTLQHVLTSVLHVKWDSSGTGTSVARVAIFLLLLLRSVTSGLNSDRASLFLIPMVDLSPGATIRLPRLGTEKHGIAAPSTKLPCAHDGDNKEFILRMTYGLGNASRNRGFKQTSRRLRLTS